MHYLEKAKERVSDWLDEHYQSSDYTTHRHCVQVCHEDGTQCFFHESFALYFNYEVPYQEEPLEVLIVVREHGELLAFSVEDLTHWGQYKQKEIDTLTIGE